MNEDILNGLINGVLVPLMSIVLIARALRVQDTGTYVVSRDKRLIYFAIIIACMQSFLIIPRFGIGLEMMFWMLFVTAFPFPVSIALVKVSGRLRLNICYQIRRSDQLF